MNRYEELSALVAVVEQGSFSGAAEYLGVAKSAVSRRVSDLESRLGVRLLNRTTRKLNLTEPGRSLHERAVRILADWEEAEQIVSAQAARLSGPLRIATPLTFGIRYLGPVLAEFARAHPDVRLDVDLNDRKVDLVAEGFDLAIRIGKLTDSSLVARRLSQIDMVCVASPGYLAKHGAPQSPGELSGHQAFRYTLAGRNRWRFLDGNGRPHQGRPQDVMIANNGELIVQACAEGLGLALLPLFIAHEGIRDGSLVTVLNDYRLESAGMYLVYPPGRYLSRRVRVFSDLMVQHFQDKSPWADCPIGGCS